MRVNIILIEKNKEWEILFFSFKIKLVIIKIVCYWYSIISNKVKFRI